MQSNKGEPRGHTFNQWSSDIHCAQLLLPKPRELESVASISLVRFTVVPAKFRQASHHGCVRGCRAEESVITVSLSRLARAHAPPQFTYVLESIFHKKCWIVS